MIRLRDVTVSKDKQISELKVTLSARNEELLTMKAIDRRQVISGRTYCEISLVI